MTYTDAADLALPHSASIVTDGDGTSEVAELCARLIRFDTSNRGSGDAEGEREIAELIADRLSSDGFAPVVLESAPRRTNVVVRIPGTDPLAPALLVHGHLDVVPAEASSWAFAPFAGDVHDGYVRGRGAVDMKDMCATVLTVLRGWARTGRRPTRDVVVAFVADEEDGGAYGARWLAAEHPGLFEGCVAGISESGGYTVAVNGTRLYPIGTAERGTMHLRVTAHGRAGHGSRPNPDNAVVALAEALARVAAHRWPVQLTPAVDAFLTQSCAAVGVAYDRDDVDATLARLGKVGAMAAAVVRPSVTPTVLRAGYKVNVIPETATADLDTRLLPGGADQVLAELDGLLGPRVTREFLRRDEAISAPMESPWFDAMAAALRAEDPDAVVVPYCMGGGTDAKAFAPLGIDGYGFAPLHIPADPGYDYRSMAHGVDERVPVAGLEFGVRVLDRFLSTV